MSTLRCRATFVMISLLALCLGTGVGRAQTSPVGSTAYVHRVEIVVDNGKVRARDEAGHWLDVPNHPAIHVNWQRQESVVWFCSTNDFAVRLDKGNPFYREFPANSTQTNRLVSSGPARPGPYNGREYKFSVVIPGVGEMDPHIIVEP